jgi:sugar lactone lactonase YvrE
VRIFDAEGKPAGQIEVPTPNVTSCAIGGPALDQLFITTAQNGQDQGGGVLYIADLAS